MSRPTEPFPWGMGPEPPKKRIRPADVRRRILSDRAKRRVAHQFKRRGSALVSVEGRSFRIGKPILIKMNVVWEDPANEVYDVRMWDRSYPDEHAEAPVELGS